MRAIPNQTDMGSDTFPSRQSLRESAGPNQNTEHEMAQPSWPSWSGIRAIANQTDGRSVEMVADNPLRISVIRWRIPAGPSGYPPGGADSAADGRFPPQTWRISGYPKGYPEPMAGWKGFLPAGEVLPTGEAHPRRLERFPSSRRGMYLAGWRVSLPLGEVHVPRRLEGSPSSRRGTCTSPTGRETLHSARYMYLAGWKEALPVDEVHVPRRLEGKPSTRRGTCTSPTGRETLHSARYMYLADWKGNPPLGEVHVPRRLEGKPSTRRGTCTLPTGGETLQLTRYVYLVEWKGNPPPGEVHVPRRLEGNPSSRRGTCLAGWKEALPAGKDVPRRPVKGRVSEDTRSDTRSGGGIPARGCGCGCGCGFPLKRQPDIRIRADIRMQRGHL
ncbi:hypothetical protein PGT21_021317 [Puccinia graminis f. sp. tritici]|uniref:Uncharacterized protein n=1 Tax=Puccinia graminis f. sp. tritici TaxID=56615 RepID=A0A5B0NCS7_PUCGR|nr:hypothetical protein PGT21_021317 [Puccinia graminis f. sp. tritici]